MRAVHWQSDAAPVWASSVAAAPSRPPLRPHSQPGVRLHWGIVVAIGQHLRCCCLLRCQVLLLLFRRHHCCCLSVPPAPRRASVVSEKPRYTRLSISIYHIWCMYMVHIYFVIKIYKYISGYDAYSQVLLRGLLQERLVVWRLFHLALRQFTQLRRQPFAPENEKWKIWLTTKAEQIHIS